MSTTTTTVLYPRASHWFDGPGSGDFLPATRKGRPRHLRVTPMDMAHMEAEANERMFTPQPGTSMVAVERHILDCLTIAATHRRHMAPVTGDYRPNGGHKSRNRTKRSQVYLLAAPIPEEES